MAGNKPVVDAQRRVGTRRNLGPLEPRLRKRMLGALPTLMVKIGATGPLPSTLELELAAHVDGAHYRPHTDLPIGPERKLRTIRDDRVLSSVLYFHAEPKAFSGGTLRRFLLGAENTDDESAFVEIPPIQTA